MLQPLFHDGELWFYADNTGLNTTIWHVSYPAADAKASSLTACVVAEPNPLHLP